MEEPYYKKKQKQKKGVPARERWNRFSWLAEHPEDKWIDEENQRARQKGLDEDGIRQLMAAMCLQACKDYKAASMGKSVDRKFPEQTLVDCHKFFGDDIFQFFTNGMKVKEIEDFIRKTPEKILQDMWKIHETNVESASGAKPIIEECV